MPLWLFPVGVLTAIALISLSNLTGYLLAMVWGWVLFPYGAAYIHSHPRAPGGGNHPFRDDDTHYWRTKLL